MKILTGRLFLGSAGVLALGIGAAITIAPNVFYGSYGIELPPGPDLMSELRAPGANLAVLGTLILIGSLRAGWTTFSTLLGALVFLAYATGRAISITLDGMPSEGILLAMVLELIIGGICAAMLFHQKEKAAIPVPGKTHR